PRKALKRSRIRGYETIEADKARQIHRTRQKGAKGALLIKEKGIEDDAVDLQPRIAHGQLKERLARLVDGQEQRQRVEISVICAEARLRAGGRRVVVLLQWGGAFVGSQTAAWRGVRRL